MFGVLQSGVSLLSNGAASVGRFVYERARYTKENQPKETNYIETYREKTQVTKPFADNSDLPLVNSKFDDEDETATKVLLVETVGEAAAQSIGLSEDEESIPASRFLDMSSLYVAKNERARHTTENQHRETDNIETYGKQTKHFAENSDLPLLISNSDDQDETDAKALWVETTGEALLQVIGLSEEEPIHDSPFQDRSPFYVDKNDLFSLDDRSKIEIGVFEQSESNKRIDGKRLKKKPKMKQNVKGIKRKRQACKSSVSRHDEDDNVRLINIHKEDDSRTSTSDYASEISDDAWPAPFQRNNGTRMSNMYRWNSVIGFAVPNQKTQEQTEQTTPMKQQSSVVIGTVKNSIFSAGPDGVQSSTVMSCNSTEWDRISAKVKDQTLNTLRTLTKYGPYVETEGMLAAKQVLEETNKSNRLVIFLGSGDGATTAANKLMADYSKFDKHAAIDDESPDSDWEGFIPYVINDPADWNAIDMDRPAVIAVHDPAGAIKTDMNRLDDAFSHIKQCLMSLTDVRIIVAMRKLPDLDGSVLTDTFGGRVIDLQSKQHGIKTQTKQKIIETFMKRWDIQYIPEALKEDKGTADSQERNITRATVEELARIADPRGFMKSVERFFEDHFDERIKYFSKPDAGIIEQIKHMYETHDPGFFALLAIHDYGGELSIDRVEQIKRSLMANKSMSVMAMDLSPVENFRYYNYKPFIPLQSLVMRYAKKMKNLGDVIMQGMEQLENDLLEENNNIYRFRSTIVENSLLVVLANLFPAEVLSSCAFEFIIDYVRPRSWKWQTKIPYVAVESKKRCEVKDALIKRITTEMLQRNISKCTNHPVFRESWFVDDMFAYWRQTKQLWKILQQQESNLYPYCLVYFGQQQQFRFPSKDNANNAAEKVLLQTIWDCKRSPKSKWTKWIHSQQQEAMMKAIELNRCTTIKLLLEKGTMVTADMLTLAVNQEHPDIVRLLKKEKEPLTPADTNTILKRKVGESSPKKFWKFW